MKKILILITLLVMLSCSDNPTEPKKEYPISHKSKAVDLAIKINQIRRLNGLEEFLYTNDASYAINGETKSFNTHTGYEDDDFFYVNDTYRIQSNDTTYEAITRLRIYLENTDDVINDLITNYKQITEVVYSGETTIAINIVERESTKLNKVAIDYYLYYIVRNYNN